MMRNAITVFRVLRILRIAKLLQRFDNIQILLDSLILITPNISNILLLLTLVIYIYALIGIYMLAGVK
jgi:voltage-gated sodium channel